MNIVLHKLKSVKNPSADIIAMTEDFINLNFNKFSNFL